MTTSLQRHLLLKLSKAQTLGEQGFTLVELLVVIIIIGILSAVALPNFLGQTAKARASEGKASVGAALRALQAWKMENPSATTGPACAELGLSSSPNFTLTCNSLTQVLASGVSGSNASKICVLGDINATSGAFTITARQLTTDATTTASACTGGTTL